MRHFVHSTRLLMLAGFVSIPVSAQNMSMPTNAAFNAAIINGPSIMAMGLAVPRGGAEREVICGRMPENDEERAILRGLAASGRCRGVTDASSFAIASRALQPGAKLPSAESAATLRYSPSIARRQANYAGFINRSRKVDPAGTKNLEAILGSDPVAAMGPELAKVGLTAANVADAYTVYWVEAWQAVHGVTSSSSRDTAKAVKRQASDMLLSTPGFTNATESQKQEIAESLLVQALLVGAAKEQAQGDRAQLAKVAAAVEQGARATGLDLRAMMLTENGFVSAKRTGAADPAPGAEPKALAAANDVGAGPGYGFLAAAGGAGLGAALLVGKALGRKG